jgi:ABC-type lipoprotein release transport system permease subunit
VATFYALLFGPIGLSVAPVIDVFLLYGLLTGNATMLAIAGAMLAFLMIVTAVALISERDRLWHLVFVPLQYSYMRVLTLLTLGAAIKNAVSGLRPVWRAQQRQGIGRLTAEQGGAK